MPAAPKLVAPPITNTSTPTFQGRINAVRDLAEQARDSDEEIADAAKDAADGLEKILRTIEGLAGAAEQGYARGVASLGRPRTDVEEAKMREKARDVVLAVDPGKRAALVDDVSAKCRALGDAIERTKALTYGPLASRRKVDLDDLTQQAVFAESFKAMSAKRILEQYAALLPRGDRKRAENFEVAALSCVTARRSFTPKQLAAVAGEGAGAIDLEQRAWFDLADRINAELTRRAPTALEIGARAFDAVTEIFADLVGFSIRYTPMGQAWMGRSEYLPDALKRFEAKADAWARFLPPSPFRLAG